jgi:hypothetical protein
MQLLLGPVTDDAMRNPSGENKTRVTVEELAEAARCEVELEWQRIQQTYSKAELVSIVREAEKPKRGKGRPATARRYEIIDAAAKVKAEGGHYTRLAARFHLRPKQLTDLVQTNRLYFNRKVREFRTTK